MYKRLSRNFIHSELIPKSDNVYDHIGADVRASWYLSVFDYTEEQYEKWKTTKSVAGADGVTGNLFYWDFDSHLDLNQAKQDAIDLIERLEQYKVDETQYRVFFSGKKGFSVILSTQHKFDPVEVKTFCSGIASGLTTFDDRIYDNQRVLRVPLTAHQETGLFKIPLTIEALKSWTIEQIIEEARDPAISIEEYRKLISSYANITHDDITKFESKKRKKKVAVLPTTINPDDHFPTIDWSKRIKFLTPEKYVLHCGYFPPGQRNSALMILASTYKMLGFTAGDAYRMLKSAIEKQSQIYQEKPFAHDELWVNIVQVVFSDTWNGGVYGSDHPLLTDIIAKLPVYLRRQTEDYSIVANDYVFGKLDRFMDDLNTSILTTKIKTFDENVLLLTGNSIGIVGCPGSAKTSLLLNIMRNFSKTKEEKQACVFYSLDMNPAMIGLKQIQFVSGLGSKEIMELRRKDPAQFAKYRELAYAEFGNIDFSFRHGVSPANIREDLLKFEEKTGKKVMFVVVDYLEQIISSFEDVNIGAASNAQKLTDIAGEMDLLMFILLQTQKTTKPGFPIEDMRCVKGGSQIEQSLSVLLGIHREGQPAKWQQYDSTIDVSILKNRFGHCGNFTLGWEGKTGIVTDMTPDQKTTHKLLKDMKLEEKKAEQEERRQKTGW